jgi:hypothetical protein
MFTKNLNEDCKKSGKVAAFRFYLLLNCLGCSSLFLFVLCLPPKAIAEICKKEDLPLYQSQCKNKGAPKQAKVIAEAITTQPFKSERSNEDKDLTKGSTVGYFCDYVDRDKVKREILSLVCTKSGTVVQVIRNSLRIQSKPIEMHSRCKTGDTIELSGKGAGDCK